MDDVTQQILTEYIADLDAGLAPDPETFARRCPGEQGPLRFRQLLGELDQLRGLLPEPRPAPEWIGDYRVEGELGHGGMGVVYAAVSGDGRRVAIKMLPDDQLITDQHAARFRRETEVLSSLDHPNIARVLELGRDRDRPFLVMEALDGGSLVDQLDQRRRRGAPTTDEDIRQVCRIIARVARAAASAHSHGVVHRDIKPSNILIDERGEPCLTDFGLAFLEEASTLTSADRVLGTPAYIAPERLLDPQAVSDPRVDVFSLGVTLFESIALVRPFQGALPEVLAATRFGPPPMRLFLGRPVGRSLDAILERALAHRPARRYPSALHLAEDLEAWLANRPVRALRGARVRRLGYKLRRHPLAASSLALSLLLLVASQAYRVHQSRLLRQEVDRLLSAAEGPQDLFRRATGAILAQIKAPHRSSRNDWCDFGQRHLQNPRPEAIEGRLEALRKTAEEARGVVEPMLLQAVVLGSEVARQSLFDLYRRHAIWLEWQGRFEAAEVRWKLAVDGDRGELPPLGRIQVGPAPVSAVLRLLRFDRSSPTAAVWKLEEVAAAQEWRAPVEFSRLDPGSYLLELQRQDGERIIRHPLLLHRGEQILVEGLELPTDDEIGEGWEYVPAGTFVAGGDPRAEASEPRSVRYLAGFFVRRFEVTMVEYLEFLFDLKRRGVICDDQAYRSYMLQKGWPADLPVHIHRDDRDTPPPYTLEELASGIVPNLGVSTDMALHRVSHRDAQHFIGWLNQRARERGEPWLYALPSGDQWEKAARGADGRSFAWGDAFDWRLTAGAYTKHHVQLDENRHMAPGRIPEDSSPYGLLDMVGNLREHCADLDTASGRYLVRGGEESYYRPDAFRLAARRGALLDEYNWDFGFRVVRTRRE